MKFGMRTPSFSKRVAARTSWQRVARHSLGLKAPRGMGWVTNPKRAAYNRVYNRTTFKADNLIVLVVIGIFWLIGALFSSIVGLFSGSRSDTLQTLESSNSNSCPRCHSQMILRNGRRGKFYGCSRFPACRGTTNYSEPS
jgi:hypothetical protein